MLNGTGTVFDATNAVNFSSTGTVYVNAATVSGTKTIVNGFNETQADDGYSVATSGTNGIILNTADVITLTGGFYSVDLTGFAGTLSNTARTIYGNWLTPASGGTYTAGAVATTFGSTNASARTITSNGRTLDFPITFNGSSGKWTLQDTLTIGATRALTWTNGTLDVNNQNISGAASITINGGTFQLNNTGGTTFSTALAVTQSTGTFYLGTNLTVTNASGYTLTAGSLYLWPSGGSTPYKLTTTVFSSSGTGVRYIDNTYGSSIDCTGTGTVWNTGTSTNLTTSDNGNIGNVVVNVTSAGSTAITVASGTLSSADAISFNFTGGTYALTFLGTTGYTAGNVDFTGYGGTLGAIAGNVGGNSATIYGALTLSSAMTLTASASTLIFGSGVTGGSFNITTAGKTLDFPINFNAVNNTLTLQDNFAVGATRAMTWAGGTLDLNNKTFSGFVSLTVLATTNTFVLNNTGGTVYSTTVAITHTSGGLSLGTNLTTTNASGYTFTAGTLTFNNYTLTTTIFASNNTNVRVINFGTSGNITCNGSGASLFNMATSSANFTRTGNPIVNIDNNTATASTVACAYIESNALSFNFISGTYTLTFLGTAGYTAGAVNFTGFSGTWAATSTGALYGNLTLSATMTLTTSASIMTLSGTSGTKTITSNGKSIPFPITVNSIGATWKLLDAFTLATVTTALTHAGGTFDLNGLTATVGTYTVGANSNNKNLTFNGGTLLVTGSGTTAFNNTSTGNYTTTAGTGTGYIRLNSSTAKTFVGGGSTYNCTVSHDGSGTLTFSGSSSFSSIATGITPAAFIFTAGTTQTVASWGVNGTSGNLITIDSSVSGTLANISKTDGGYMDYVSVKDIAFQPCSTDGSGALPMLWFAGANSTNRGNNFGISFEAYIENAKTYYISLTSVSSWTLPADWNPNNNTIHLIGGGGGGAGSRSVGGLGGGPGGGGGGYTKILNYSSVAGTVVSTAVGAAGAAGAANGAGGAGGTTVFGAYTAGGGGGGSYGTGGAAGVGSTYNGGRGGLGSNYSGVNGGSGGGGGAGGPYGPGGQGGDNYVTNGGATGGGGNGGGYAGSTTAGGNGWLNTGGGVGAVAGTLGTGGGGGPSGAFTTGKNGGSGFDIYGFIGGGGGGGGNFGGSGGGPGGTGGNYGAGGAGAGLNAGANPATFSGGPGASGLIVIRYIVAAAGTGSSGSFFSFF